MIDQLKNFIGCDDLQKNENQRQLDSIKTSIESLVQSYDFYLMLAVVLKMLDIQYQPY
jgi:hypothetical protein